MSRPTYSRQVGSREEAEKRVAEIRKERRWASDPVQVYAPNGQLVWGFSAGFDVEKEPEGEKATASN